MVGLIAVLGTGWMEVVKLVKWRTERPLAFAIRAMMASASTTAATVRAPNERTALLGAAGGGKRW